MTLIRSLVLVGCMAGLVVTTPTAAAQQARAYAPENLRALSVNDRTRVIRQEYAEQARGRQIPDDQLRFYLDQVQQSTWTFSQIKSDIATSLGGNGGWRPPTPDPGPGPGTGNSIRCESSDGRSKTCTTPWRANSRLLRQLSSTRCIEGQNWSSRRGQVTVNNGCRAEFGPGKGGGQQQLVTVQCESTDGRMRTCGSNLRGRITLSRQISNTRCVAETNYGLRNGSVWVDRGCRGVFLVQQGNGHRPPDSTYNVTCSSNKNRYTTCAWDARQGVPRLLQTLSSTACTEGRSWGYSLRTGLWVNGGCRGRFGIR